MSSGADTAEDDSYWRDVIHGSKRKLIEWISEEPSDLLDELDCKELIHRDVYKQVKEISDFKKQSRFLLDHFIDSQEENCKNFLQSLRDVKNNYHPELQDWIENLGGWNKSQQDISKKSSDTNIVDTGPGRQPRIPSRVPINQEVDDNQIDKPCETKSHIKPALAAKPPHLQRFPSRVPTNQEFDDTQINKPCETKSHNKPAPAAKPPHLQSIRNTIKIFEAKARTTNADMKPPISYYDEPSYLKEIGDEKSTSTYRISSSEQTNQELDDTQRDGPSEEQGCIKLPSSVVKSTPLPRLMSSTSRTSLGCSRKAAKHSGQQSLTVALPSFRHQRNSNTPKKMQPENYMNTKKSNVYMEDTTIVLPIMQNGVGGIGALWDCHSSDFTNHNLFGKQLEKHHVIFNPLKTSHHNLTPLNNTEDHVKLVKLSGATSVEFLSGLIKIEGCGEYNGNVTSSVNEEQLICQYYLENGSLFLLPQAKHVIDKKVQNVLSKGKIKATHVVNGLILGAEVNAHVRLRKTGTDNRDDSSIGKLIFGKISASVKAQLEMLDSDKAQSYETHITIHSKPPMRHRQPSTIKEMFDVLEKVDTIVAEERHYKFIDPSITGVPLRLVLVPIAQFLDVEVERLYMQIEETLLDDFRTMLVSLQDLRGPACIKRRVLEKDNRLSPILSDHESTLSKEISEYENVLKQKVEFLFIRACKVLKEYKMALATCSHVHSIVQEYEKSGFNEIDLYARVDEFVVGGMGDGSGIPKDDATRMWSDIRLLTNHESLREWMSTESNIKIMLCTKDNFTSGIFKRLFILSEPLKALKIEVGIALPSISSDFYLSIKVKDELKYYKLADIPLILSILSAAVKRDLSVESRFYTIMASLFDIELPLQANDFHNLNRLVDTLKIENVHIASSYMESLQCICSDTCWIFFVPIDAFDTAHEAICKLRVDLTNLEDANGRLVVGSLGIPNQHEAPLLFVFRAGRIKAICMDHLDILILADVFKVGKSSNKEPDFFVLSPDSMKCSMYQKRANYAIKTVEYFHKVKHPQEDYDQLKMPSFDKIPDENVNNALVIARSYLTLDDMHMIVTTASLAIRDNLEIGNILEKHGWKRADQRFEKNVLNLEDCYLICNALQDWLRSHHPFLAKVYSAKWAIEHIQSSPGPHSDESITKIKNAVQSVSNDPQCPEKVKHVFISWQESTFEQKCQEIKRLLDDQLCVNEQEQSIIHVTSLIHILKRVYQNDLCYSSIHTIIKKYVNKVDFQKGHIATSSTRVNQYTDNNEIYHLIGLLAKLQYDHRLVAIHSSLDTITELNDPQAVVSLLDLLSGDEYERLHWEQMWTNLSFKYLIKNVISNDNVLRKINSVILKFNMTDKNPTYIPEDIQKKLSHFNNEQEFIMPQRIENLESCLSVLKKISKINEIPDNFRVVLTKSIANDEHLKRSLHQANALFYWNTDNLFDQVWCLQTVRKAVENISTFIEKQKSTTCYSGSEYINITIDNEVTSNKTSVKNLVNVHKDVTSVFGDSLPWITPSSYLEVRDIVLKPNASINIKSTIMCAVLPFLIQTLKMWGGNVLQANAISSLVRVDAITKSGHASKGPTFRNISAPTKSRQTQEQNKVPFSRLDCVVALLSCADCTVAQDLLQVMMKFPMALPLVMPDLEMKDKYKVMLPLLSGNTIKWEAQSGVIVENNLFISPFRLILAVRLGTNSRGKSTILNQLLSVEHLFSSCGEPGAHRGPPQTLAGTVEFTWLTQETCGAGLWESVLKQFYARGKNEIVLLANLHGDASEYPEVIQFLKEITSTYIVFVMPDEENMQIKWDRLASLTDSEDNLLYLMVDPNKECNEPDDCIIQTAWLTNDDMLGKVRDIFSKALDSSLLKGVFQKLTYPNHGKSLHPTRGIETEYSKKLVKFIEENRCQTVRDAMKFQSQDSTNNRTAALWQGNKVLQDVITLYGNVLCLPLADRLRALAHADRDISMLSNDESADIRKRISKQRDELRRQVTLRGHNQGNVKQIKQKIYSDMEQLDKMSLGPEHFYRELGCIYELIQGGKTKSNYNNVLKLPKSYAELLINGFAIELLNGDTGEIPGAWFIKICQHISEAYPNLRIFVISILGLQSSGKSTLLNALFACKFAVSVGRCTRGLFMRLLFLEKALGERLKTDAILLIDTEGLGAPEKMNDTKAEKKDRILATFAMSVSNLTIINVLGEYMRDLTEILQIAIVAMARLEQAKMAPDILMVQHLTERNITKTSSGQDQFCEALDNAIKLTRENDVDVGILDVNCLKKLAARIQNGELLKQFRPFKNGASAGAPPSEQYHADVVDLYKTILDACQQSDNNMLFSDWYSLVQNYWSCVMNENFAVRFKNIQEIYEFIERGKQIAALKEKIDSTFSKHRESLKTKMNQAMQNLTNESQHQIRESVLKMSEEELKLVPIACQDCRKCIGVMEERERLNEYAKKHQCEHDVMRTINGYIQHVRRSTMKTLIQMLDAAIVGKGYSVEFLDEITRQLKCELDKRPAGQFSKEEQRKIVDKIWKSLLKIANEKDTDLPDERKIHNEILQVYKTSHVPQKYLTNEQTYTFANKENWMKRVISKWFPKSTNNNNIDCLANQLEKIATSMLASRNAEHYEEGMIRELKKNIDHTLSKFGNALDANMKWDAHIFTLQKFCQEMKVCQIKWEKKHKPTEILKEREHDFRSMIDTRLTYGFSAASEGILIAKYLLQAINQKATRSVNDLRVDAVLGLPWTTNSEIVRLKYFERLASQVQKGQTAEAVEYFTHPKTSIDKWFSETVDGHVCAKEKEEFDNTFKAEYDRVVQKIRNCSNISSILKFTQEYLANVDKVEYKSSLNNHDISTMDLSLFLDSILNVFNNSKQNNGPDIKWLKKPSTNKKVMKRTGCTDNCLWCGALCWGSRGHDENSDETRKHHSCHQPCGLHGTRNYITKELMAESCHSWSDDRTAYWGDKQMKWCEIKALPECSNWKFDSHCNATFDTLMRWFFQQLHQQIAQTMELRPATQHQLQTNKCENLHLESIMANIRVLIEK